MVNPDQSNDRILFGERRLKMIIRLTCLLAAAVPLSLTATLYAQIEAPADVSIEVFAEPTPNPIGLSFDSNGVLYVAFDEGRSVSIRRISPDGLSITSFGPALLDPDAVAVDSNDNVYVGSENGLYRFAPDGTSTLVTRSYMGNNTCLAIDHHGVFGLWGISTSGTVGQPMMW